MAQQDIRSTYTDDLSEFSREVLKLSLAEAYKKLVVRGDGTAEAQLKLSQASARDMISGTIQNQSDAEAMLAGLWLWHDWLDESHRISQSISSATGSFWHAIMHRREGDFSNSQYWYARCQNHPVMQSLAQHAGQILHAMPADKQLLRLVGNGWNANAFVDLVSAVEGDERNPKHAAAVSLQQMEWRLLFDHCTRSAAGK